MADETKKCKHCSSEIPKDAKICPNCRKKQGGKLKWIIIVIVVIFVVAAAASGGEDKSDGKKVGNTDKETNNSVSSAQKGEGEEETEEDNIFQVGDIVETDELRISFLSAGRYDSSDIIQPDSGKMFYRVEFEIENISDTDQYVNEFDFDCYADGYSSDITMLVADDEMSSASLSKGKKIKGAIYYQVPVDAKEIEVEYETNIWTENKIVFKCM